MVPSQSTTTNPDTMSLLEWMTGKFDSLNAKIESLHSLFISRRKDFYTVEEVADIVGRSAFTVRRWVSEGKLHATRIEGTGPRGKLLIPRSDLEHLIAQGLGENIPDPVVGSFPNQK